MAVCHYSEEGPSSEQQWYSGWQVPANQQGSPAMPQDVHKQSFQQHMQQMMELRGAQYQGFFGAGPPLLGPWSAHRSSSLPHMYHQATGLPHPFAPHTHYLHPQYRASYPMDDQLNGRGGYKARNAYANFYSTNWPPLQHECLQHYQYQFTQANSKPASRSQSVDPEYSRRRRGSKHNHRNTSPSTQSLPPNYPLSSSAPTGSPLRNGLSTLNGSPPVPFALSSESSIPTTLAEFWFQGLMKVGSKGSRASARSQTRPLPTILLASETSSLNVQKTSVQLQGNGISVQNSSVSVHNSSVSVQNPHAIAPRMLVGQLFESIKAYSKTYLNYFIKQLPKTDLHIHSGGALSDLDIINWAADNGYYFDPRTYLFSKDEKPDLIKSKDLRDLPKYREILDKYREKMSVGSCADQSKTGRRQHFFDAFKIIDSLTKDMPLADKLFPVIKNAWKDQNVRYMELMIERLPPSTPDGFEECFNRSRSEALEMLRNTGWIERYVTKQIEEIDRSNETVSRNLGLFSIIDKERPVLVTDEDSPIVISYILEIMRDMPNHEFFAQVAAAMALMPSCSCVVGLNVVGEEDGVLALNNFGAQMEILGYLYNQFDKPNITLHAGELNSSLTPAEVRNHIRDSIVIGMAKRIGHGANLNREDLPQLFHLMLEENVAVEVCLASNMNILGIDPKDNSMGLYLERGITVIPCSDDPAINHSALTEEYVTAVLSANLPWETVRKMLLDGISYSFLPEGDKKYQLERMELELQSFEKRTAQFISAGRSVVVSEQMSEGVGHLIDATRQLTATTIIR